MQNPVIQRIKRRAEVCQSLPVTCGRRGNDTGNGMVTVGSIQCAVDCFPENGKSPHSKPFTFLLLPAAKCRSGMFFTLYAAFYKFFERHQEERALVAANYIKYGTDDPKEIWLLKYGVMFEDMETLKPHIQDINEQEIVVAQSYYELPPENQKVIERFVN